MDTSARVLLDTLASVRALEVDAHGDLDAHGIGTVEVSRPSPDIVVFHESGSWTDPDIGFRNAYRWRLIDDARIRVEHLRHTEPVQLLDVAPGPDGRWFSVEPHLCDQDRYTIEMKLPAVTWTIDGPDGTSTLSYRYR